MFMIQLYTGFHFLHLGKTKLDLQCYCVCLCACLCVCVCVCVFVRVCVYACMGGRLHGTDPISMGLILPYMFPVCMHGCDVSACSINTAPCPTLLLPLATILQCPVIIPRWTSALDGSQRSSNSGNNCAD